MATVIIEAPGHAPVTVTAPEGGALIDICDDTQAAVPFSCRSASCGTCRVVVLEGAEHLTDPEDEELDVLDVFAVAPPRFRLACQARLRAGAGCVRLRPVTDGE
jgi:2Fe-2S ferredoxin